MLKQEDEAKASVGGLKVAWNTGLAGVHLAIAGYPNSPLRVLAGPGTGKTYALMRRVARLLEAGGAPNENFSVTFTPPPGPYPCEKLTNIVSPAGHQGPVQHI